MVHTLDTTRRRPIRRHRPIDKSKAELLTKSTNSNKALHSIYVEYNPKRVNRMKVLKVK
jgi:hypothetical protein